MKKIVLIFALFLVLAGCNQSREQPTAKDELRIPPSGAEEKQSEQKTIEEKKDWYAINLLEDRCKEYSVAATIRAYQTIHTPYQVIDDKIENGRPVQVTIKDLSDSTYMTFYYGIERCQEALKGKNVKNEKELEKYK